MNTLVSLYRWLPITLIAVGGSALILTIRTKSAPKPVEIAGLTLMWLIFTGDAALSHQSLIERVSKGIAAFMIAICIVTLAWRRRRRQPGATDTDPAGDHPVINRRPTTNA